MRSDELSSSAIKALPRSPPPPPPRVGTLLRYEQFMLRLANA